MGGNGSLNLVAERVGDGCEGVEGVLPVTDEFELCSGDMGLRR